MRTISRIKQNKRAGMYILLFGGCICVMLLVALIASAIRSGERAESASLNALAAEERTELEAALAVFDTIGYPNADIAGEILPAMRLHFHTATTLDSLIVSCYGAEYSLLDEDVLRYINLTLDELETAAQQGNSTELGVENLGVYMLILRNDLGARFDEQGAILPLE